MQFTGVALNLEMPLPKRIRLLREFSITPFYKIYIATLLYRFFKVMAWFLRRKLTHVPCVVPRPGDVINGYSGVRNIVSTRNFLDTT